MIHFLCFFILDSIFIIFYYDVTFFFSISFVYFIGKLVPRTAFVSVFVKYRLEK